jgi:hypothetical protein
VHCAFIELAHVWVQYDFPETVTTLEEIGVAAGFRSVSIEHVADKGLSQFIAMEA